jgi:hypothetical protein
MLLEWDPVVTDILGNSLTVSSYSIYMSDQPYIGVGEASLLGTSYTNSFMIENAQTMGNRAFFQITAVTAGDR